MNKHDPYWKDQDVVVRLRLLRRMCNTETSREVADQCIALAQGTPGIIASGEKCMNAAMVLHDHYVASGDKENAAICKMIAEEWRKSVRDIAKTWTADQINGILAEAEKQVETMTDGKVIPSFVALAQRHGLQ